MCETFDEVHFIQIRSRMSDVVPIVNRMQKLTSTPARRKLTRCDCVISQQKEFQILFCCYIISIPITPWLSISELALTVPGIVRFVPRLLH